MQCPICGSELKQLPLQWFPERRAVLRGNIVVTLSGTEAKIFQLLWDATHTGRAVNTGALFDALYGADPNGGPGKTALPMHLTHLRKLIAPLDLSLKHASGTYRLSVKDGPQWKP